jgi:hypothetical protein
VVARQPLRVENAFLNLGNHRTAGLGLVAAVTKATVLGGFLDLGEGGGDRSRIEPQTELANPREIRNGRSNRDY